MRIYQHLRAANDPNGNPQRLFVVYETDSPAAGNIVAVLDEGYQGRGVLREAGISRDTIEIPSLDISRSTYHELRRRHPETR